MIPLLLVVCLLSPVLVSAEVLPGPYVAEVTRIVDGDTFTATVRVQVKAKVKVWLDTETEVTGETVIHATVRPRGFDTPESYRPKCPEEKALGLRAKEILAGVLTQAPVVLRNIDYDRNGGRVQADVTIGPEGLSLTAVMIQTGYARAWSSPGVRQSWCD